MCTGDPETGRLYLRKMKELHVFELSSSNCRLKILEESTTTCL